MNILLVIFTSVLTYLVGTRVGRRLERDEIREKIYKITHSHYKEDIAVAMQEVLEVFD